MLEKSRLNPPRRHWESASGRAPEPTGVSASARDGSFFVSAEDFDCTGILAGCDPCASSYWWMPELFATEPDLLGADLGHATLRAASRPTAAA